MLQIISGKFFGECELNKTHRKEILFSNCKCYAEIKTDIGILEAVNYGDIAGYVFNYDYIYPKGETNVCGIGIDEILSQIKVICSFGLKGYFSEYREQAAKICASIKAKSALGVTSCNFLETKLALKKTLSPDEIADFVKLVHKIISLKHDAYKRVIRALQSVSDSIEIMEYNINLAYSMLVFGLETLSNEEKYSPMWDDHPKASDLSPILNKIEPELAANIRKILLKDSHLKLIHRYKSFIERYTSDDFFTKESENILNPIRNSQLNEAVSNAYELRSGFAHKLESIPTLVASELSKDEEVVLINKKLYMTYNGLLRLVHHVAGNYIQKAESLEREDIKWRRELPGLMSAPILPECWINNASSSFTNKNVKIFFDGLISIWDRGAKICSMVPVIEEAIRTFSQANEENKGQIVRFVNLYSYFRDENFLSEFITSNKQYLSELNFDNMVTCAITEKEFPGNAKDCIDKYKPETKLRLPSLAHVMLLCSIANKALGEELTEDYLTFMDNAIREIPGKEKAQKYLQKVKEVHKKVVLKDLKNFYLNFDNSLTAREITNQSRND